jgi:uncharacterized membrane protein YhiD involved in acid resistance
MIAVAAILFTLAVPVLGQGLPTGEATPPPTLQNYLTWEFQLQPLREALVSLSVAAGLASMLAFRPRRKGTPERDLAVVQTQIILAIVGSVVMLVVGASLARAFGIVGAASLVRYRAKISDPKDAGVMLSTLAIGLASGVGLYLFAAFAAAFIVVTLWALESQEPEELKHFELKVKVKDKEKEGAAELRPRVEDVLRRNRIPYELRTATTDELCYDVRVPIRKTTDRLSNQILALEKSGMISVDWDQKKEKK